METTDFIEIKEITSAGSTEESIQCAVDKVNNLLKEGWAIINTYTTCYDHTIAREDQTMHHVLGITYLSKLTHDPSIISTDENGKILL